MATPFKKEILFASGLKSDSDGLYYLARWTDEHGNETVQTRHYVETPSLLPSSYETRLLSEGKGHTWRFFLSAAPSHVHACGSKSCTICTTKTVERLIISSDSNSSF